MFYFIKDVLNLIIDDDKINGYELLVFYKSNALI
jgi:hypothetical protein